MTSPTDRAVLERLDRDTLIARAEGAGVSRANILTRPELVDELLLRTAKKRDDPSVTFARGFFGRARDLLARVIEQGLHLPEAADLLRRAGSSSAPPRRTAPSAVPTVTLAEIYATQGHRARAIETLKRVLDHEPDHAAARSLLTQLSSSDGFASASSLPPDTEASREESAAPIPSTQSAPPRPPAPPPSQSPEPGFLDDGMLPARYDVDECVAVSVDPTTLFAYWEIRESTLTHVRRRRPDGKVALRVLVVTPSWDGPMSSTYDIDVGESFGDWFVRDLPPGAVVRVAIGWRSEGTFLPIAHCPALETPSDKPSRLMADFWVAWSPSAGVRRLELAEAAAAGLPVPGHHGALSLGGTSGGTIGAIPATRGANGVWGHGVSAGFAGPLGSSEHAAPG